MPKGPKVLVVAGEASADRHAASLVEQWRRLDPGLDAERPDLTLLLDLPDFNLFFAGRAKARHPEIPILYYISPQVWAWRKGRVKKIKRVINQMLVLFPFEKDFYRRHGVEVEFVGHPLQDQAQASASQEELRRRFEVASASPVVALLPGSRAEELRLYLPVLKGAVSRLLARHPQIAFLAAQAPTARKETIAAQLSPERLPLKIIEGATYDVLAAADLALVASGTATLETALLQVPMVILGKVSWPNYLLARPWVSVPFYGMPNLLSGREIVPELTMWDCTAERVAAEAEAILMDRLRREAIRQDLARVRDLLGPAGASARAAGAVHAFLQGR